MGRTLSPSVTVLFPPPYHCPCHHHTEPHRAAGSSLISLFPLPQGVQHLMEGFEAPWGQRWDPSPGLRKHPRVSTGQDTLLFLFLPGRDTADGSCSWPASKALGCLMGHLHDGNGVCGTSDWKNFPSSGASIGPGKGSSGHGRTDRQMPISSTKGDGKHIPVL